MLKSAMIAMTVMGCDCDARLCTPLDVPSGGFASVEECEAAIVSLMQAGSDSYPLLAAECTPAAPMVAASSEAEALPASRHTSGTAGFLGQGMDYAGLAGNYLLYKTSDGFVAVRGSLGLVYSRAVQSAGGAASRIVSSLAGELPF